MKNLTFFHDKFNKKNIMSKKKIFWILLAVTVIAVIVLVKFAPFWVSITGVVSFGCGFFTGWWAKIFYDKYTGK